jgi:hypothetical protein
LKEKFSSSITSGDKNRAWQEIANIVNAGNSVRRDIKEIQKKWDLVLLQQYTFFSICPIWLPFRHILFSTVTNSNIQTHPTLNVYPHKLIKACIIYLLKN